MAVGAAPGSARRPHAAREPMGASALTAPPPPPSGAARRPDAAREPPLGPHLCVRHGPEARGTAGAGRGLCHSRHDGAGGQGGPLQLSRSVGELLAPQHPLLKTVSPIVRRCSAVGCFPERWHDPPLSLSSAQAGVALGCRLLSGELGMATNDVEFLKESVDQAMSARWGWWRGGGGEDRAQVRAAQQGAPMHLSPLLEKCRTRALSLRLASSSHEDGAHAGSSSDILVLDTFLRPAAALVVATSSYDNDVDDLASGSYTDAEGARALYALSDDEDGDGNGSWGSRRRVFDPSEHSLDDGEGGSVFQGWQEHEEPRLRSRATSSTSSMDTITSRD